MADTVTIYIDGHAYAVPKGMNLVDAAKLHGTVIPVFCYHPKMKPVGMCRMCLVEQGSLSVDRQTGQPERDENGELVFRWFPKLQTACTQTVSEGMAIRTSTQLVVDARDDILEFLLTSHPLDCPICDKGGECPLQNLTMAYGPGESRFVYDDKQHLAKHVPLGELIYLDRERCIQCARCTRFCEEVVGDAVLAFHERGRRLQIVTISDPPFDTKFSGNTTDICPVGALTTADFRFGARPWELDEVPSICPHCPVGCNISASTRIDRDFGGKKMIKRIMPRQNEQVNEIWICDKGRFGHHHSRAADRLEKPLMRSGDDFVAISWAEAYEQIAAQLKQHTGNTAFLAGPSLSNEDLWELRTLAGLLSDDAPLGVWPATMTGLHAVVEAGVGVGTRLAGMGTGSAILVIASDLEEEAPIWWLQVKQAADRGAKVVVANGRATKLDRYASAVIHYDYRDAVKVLNSFAARARSQNKIDQALVKDRVPGFAELVDNLKGTRVPHAEAADLLLDAENLVILAGAEGLSLTQHAELMQAAANLLIITGHVGKPDNGLIGVWPGANMQGAFDLGFSAEATWAQVERGPAMWVVAEADPAAEDEQLAAALDKASFVVVTSQFMTATARAADIVLPSQSFAEREGTYTNGMRRVQRFYTAQGPIGDSLPDWAIFAQIGALLGGARPPLGAGRVMREINERVVRYIEMNYPALAEVEDQFPDVGGDDLYYGGTAYTNTGGLGKQWETNAEKQKYNLTVRPVMVESGLPEDGVLMVPVRLLYDRGVLFAPSTMMHQRVPDPYVVVSSADAAKLRITGGDRVMIKAGQWSVESLARVEDSVPAGVALLPMNLNASPMPATPVSGSIQKLEE